MKRLLFSFFALLLALPGLSQVESGRVMVGGSVTFNVSRDKFDLGGSGTTNDPTVSFGVNPEAGYFVIDNMAVGLRLNVNFAGTRTDSDNFARSLVIVPSPFVRYYFLNLGDILLFLDGTIGVGINRFNVKVAGTADANTNTLINYTGGVGAGYFLNDNVSLDAIVRLISNTTLRPDASTFGDSNFLQVGLYGGFQIFLN